MKSPICKLVDWQVRTGQLDNWTAYHIGAGAFFCKVFQWLHWSAFWCVFGVFILGVLWEVFEWLIEGDEETYGTKEKWAYNTGSDIFVETAMALWMVL